MDVKFLHDSVYQKNSKIGSFLQNYEEMLLTTVITD